MRTSRSKTEKGGWVWSVVSVVAVLVAGLLLIYPWLTLREKIAFADSDVTAFYPMVSSFCIVIPIAGLIILWLVISFGKADKYQKAKKHSTVYTTSAKKSSYNLPRKTKTGLNFTSYRVIIVALVIVIILPYALGICWRKSLTNENLVKFYSPFGNCTAVYEPKDIEKVEMYTKEPPFLLARHTTEHTFGIKPTFTDGKTAKFEKYYFKGNMKDGMPDRMLDQMAEIKALVLSESFYSTGTKGLSHALNGLNNEQAKKLYKLFCED